MNYTLDDHVFRYLTARKTKETCEHEHCLKEFESYELVQEFLQENQVENGFYQIIMLQHQKFNIIDRIYNRRLNKKRIVVIVL